MHGTIGVAVVGCGAIARAIYLPILDELPHVTVSACVDTDAGARARMAARYPDATIAQTADEIAGCDCAIVLTPVGPGIDAHYEPVLALIEAGVPTLCEKPLSADIERAEAMVAAADRANTLLMMSVNRRFAPVYRRAAAHFTDTAIDLCIAEKSGSGGIYCEIMTNSLHVLDAMRWLCGEVAELRGWCAIEGETDLRASVAIRFVDGATGSFVMSRDAGLWVERVTLHGGGRTAVVDAPHRVELIADGVREVWSPDQDRWQMSEHERWGFRAQLEHFIACVRNDEEPHATAADGLLSHHLATRIRAL